MKSGSDKSGDMRHVDEEIRAHLVGDFAEAFELDFTRIGAGARQNHFRLAFDRLFFQCVVVDAFRFRGRRRRGRS